MVQQQKYDAGAIQPVQLLMALRNKLMGKVKIGFTISVGGSNYRTNLGNWNLGQYLQILQSQQGESTENVEIQLQITPDGWSGAWDGDDPSSWGESIPKDQKIPEEMYRPATLTVTIQNNSPQDASISGSKNLAILNPDYKKRPTDISKWAWDNAWVNVQNPRILVFLQPIWIKARFFINRPKEIQSPTLIVVHHTDGKSVYSDLNEFTKEDAKTSPHYIIDRDGEIIKMVTNNKSAQHAGASYFGGNGVNSFSIGIEIVHEDGSKGDNPFTEEQYNALITLINNLRSRYEIPKHRVVGHDDVRIPLKNCPGPNFDWIRLEEIRLGLIPDPYYISNLNPDAFPIERNTSSLLIEELKDDLRRIGYYLPKESGYGSETATAIERFKKHFLAGSRRPKDENGVPSEWDSVISGDRVDFEVAKMIKAVRSYVDQQQ
ncbi:N-acetylmuramoyl-L-alanine amidase [Candidatus Bathyarchaeota archaeon]|nr:N-acetylmuramoyl-L-alanine amidase [Candidatus Bathyarchaeota archaeon]